MHGQGGGFFFIHNLINNQNETERICVAAEPATSDEQKNMSDAELARQIGVTRQTVNNIVNGRTDPQLSRLYEIAEALGVRIHELFIE